MAVFKTGPKLRGAFFFFIHFVMGAYLLWLVEKHSEQVLGTVADGDVLMEGLGHSAWVLLAVFWGSYGWDRLKELLRGDEAQAVYRSNDPVFDSLKVSSWIFSGVGLIVFVLQAIEERGWPRLWIYNVPLLLAAFMGTAHPIRYWLYARKERGNAFEVSITPDVRGTDCNERATSEVRPASQRVVVAVVMAVVAAYSWRAWKLGSKASAPHLKTKD